MIERSALVPGLICFIASAGTIDILGLSYGTFRPQTVVFREGIKRYTNMYHR